MSEQRGPKRRRVEIPQVERLPRVGKIRLGEQVPTKSGGSLRPSKLDYFRVEAEESGVTSAEAAASFHEVYGDRPTSLRAILPGATPSDVFEGAYRLYGQNKLKRICDGTTCDERTATGGWAESPCICSARGYAPTDRDRCKLVWTLNVILPEVRGIGVWQIDTGSEISVRRVSSWLQMMHGLLGNLSMVEFVLGLVETKVAPEGKATSVYVLQPRAADLTPRQMIEGAGRSEPVYDEDTGEVVDDPQDDMPEGVPSDHFDRLELLRGYGLTDAEIGEVCKANGVASAKGLLNTEAFERVKEACWKIAEEKAKRTKQNTTTDSIPF